MAVLKNRYGNIYFCDILHQFSAPKIDIVKKKKCFEQVVNYNHRSRSCHSMTGCL